jgi:hypothetical protein
VVQSRGQIGDPGEPVQASGRLEDSGGKVKNVKLFLFLINYTLRHEDMREWEYISTFLDLGSRWR